MADNSTTNNIATSSSSNDDSTNAMDQWLAKQARERKQEVAHLTQNLTLNEMSRRQAALEQLLSNESTSEPVNNDSDTTDIQVEITSLVESRPVTAVLRSHLLRSSLEDIIRQSVTLMARNEAPNPLPRREAPASNIPPPPPVPPSVASVRREQTTPVAQRRRRQPPAPIRPPTINVEEPTADNTVPPLSPSQSEDIMQELSQIFEQGTVARVLESQFRTRLEHLIQRHMITRNLDGRAALDALEQLPPSHRRRNDYDFTNTPDNISVISATVHASVNNNNDSMTHTEAIQMKQQMRQMNSELKDLRRMMKILMNSQIETQRMVRQEVAAAIATTSSQPIAIASPALTMNRAAGKCVICMKEWANMMMYACGHICMCSTCTLTYKSTQNGCLCPVCRAPIKDMVRAFYSGHSNIDEA